MTEAPIMLIVLLLLHVLLDFVLPVWRRQNVLPNSVGKTVGMAAAHGLAVLAVLWLARQDGMFACLAAVAVALSWGLASTLVPRAGMSEPYAFVLEQSAHLATLTIVWLTGEGYWSQVLGYVVTLCSARNLLMLLAYLLIMRPASTLIASVLNPWLNTIDNSGSLKSAGTLIGYLERILILTFVLLKRWDAIGFLLTAKSILRFNEIKDANQRPLSEYVLLGTLLSFTVSIAVGLLVTRILKSWAPAIH